MELVGALSRSTVCDIPLNIPLNSSTKVVNKVFDMDDEVVNVISSVLDSIDASIFTFARHRLLQIKLIKETHNEHFARRNSVRLL